MNYLYDAYSRSTNWRMYCSISSMSMIDGWYSRKLWETIFRSVRGLSLEKARIHAVLIHRSSVYIVKYDIWSCSWVWLLLQSFVSALCSGDCVLMTGFQWCSFGWCKGDWLMQIYLMFDWFYWWIQFENLWNVVPGRKDKVVAFCRSAPTY